MADFKELREQYKEFEYRGFDLQREEDGYHATFHFAIPGLSEFDPEWFFPVLTNGTLAMEEPINEELLRRLVFQLGMAESISYYKSVCPKTVKVLCGSLSDEQIRWWRKLFYNGLGEFMYRNGIDVPEEELLEIVCVSENTETSGRSDCGIDLSSDRPRVGQGNFFHDSRSYEGCLVPVGGGKDSVVSLELLKGYGITTYTINGNSTTRKVIDICTGKKGDYRAKRTLDPRMLDLNRQGFLNGHTPFSAIVAFSSVIAAYLSGNKYIVLSNETSANETTVKDSFVNHQYSKSYEFERDFDRYLRTVTDSDIHYFSFLRPLTELQIAWLFSSCKEYHKIFRSCNVGSKKGIWCCDCPKCLFVYVILSPFLREEELIEIFGEKLLDKESLDLDFKELMGVEENKPFECVGTRREVLACMKHYVESGGKSLLTERYREFILRCPERIEEMLKEWVEENNLPEEFKKILKDRMNCLRMEYAECGAGSGSETKACGKEKEERRGKTVRFLNGKRILIWGYGREGKSTEAFLKRECPDAEVDIFEGKREEIDEEKYDYIVKSPGIVMFEDNDKFISQTEIFLREFRDQVIGVTGTKGKSTTSSMLYKVLSECTDKKVLLVGNIGKPCLDYYEEITTDTIVVFEMSCHQLMHGKVSPHVAVFLNLYEEHLDYYGTVERYFEAKSHITAYQEEGDFVFLGENVPKIATKAQKNVIGKDDLYDGKLGILGKHNLYNARFVYEIAVKIYGCEGSAVRKSLEGFEALPHRLKFVGERGGIRFYDDSISTIPEAAISAADSIPDIQTLLIGGMDRGINYGILVDFIQKRKDLKFICMYASGKRIFDEAGERENCFYVEDLKGAVELSKKITKPGKACVLSPAAASYGYFKNFEERGDVFCEYVLG